MMGAEITPPQDPRRELKAPLPPPMNNNDIIEKEESMKDQPKQEQKKQYFEISVGRMIESMDVSKKKLFLFYFALSLYVSFVFFCSLYFFV